MDETHYSNLFTCQPLGFIKRNVKVRSPRIKEKLYNSLVRPRVEYASAVWPPHEVKKIHQLGMVQRRAARWTLNRHHDTSSVKGMLEDLQWRTLEQRHTDCRLVLLFQIIHGLVQIPPTNYLQPSLNTTSLKNHNYTYQQCSTRQTILNIPSSPTPQWYGTTSPTSS